MNRRYRDKTMIFSEYEPGNELFIIQSGKVKITKIVDEEVLLAVLKAGDIFGEYSALLDLPCTATVTARTDLEVLTLTRSAFMKIVRDYPETARVLEEIGRERLDSTLLHMPYFRLIQEPGFA